ncbi:swi5-like zinc finger protein [Haplosporangium bisporale]|nr:swi5-like zinc finger protein [Haplosporangium bisporale]
MENQEQPRERSGHSRRREGLIRQDINNSYSSEQSQTSRTRDRSHSSAGRSSPTDERASSRAATSPTSVLASMPPSSTPLPPPPLLPRDDAELPVLLDPVQEDDKEEQVDEITKEDVEPDQEEKVEELETRSHSVPEAVPSTEEAGLSEKQSVPVDRQQKKRDSQKQYDLQKAKEDAKIEALKATILELQAEEQALIKKIRGEGSAKEIIDRHIQQLHEYNEIKDVGQVILGKCAELEGTTIKKQYENYGLDPTD